MGAIINSSITNDGLVVLAKGQTGSLIKFIRLSIGDGYMPSGKEPRDMANLVNEIISVNVNKGIITEDGSVEVGGVFSNEEMAEGFYYRELGLYAEDPDNPESEILYCYGNAADLAEWIPPTTSESKVEKQINIITQIQDATNVQIEIKSGIYATIEYVNEKISIVYKPKGNVDTFAELPPDANTGDIYNVLQAGGVDENGHPILAGDNVVKTDTGWDKLGGTVDLSGYPTRIEMEEYAADVLPIDATVKAEWEELFEEAGI